MDAAAFRFRLTRLVNVHVLVVSLCSVAGDGQGPLQSDILLSFRRLSCVSNQRIAGRASMHVFSVLRVIAILACAASELDFGRRCITFLRPPGFERDVALLCRSARWIIIFISVSQVCHESAFVKFRLDAF